MDHLSVTFYFGCVIKRLSKKERERERWLVLSFTCYWRDVLLIFTEMKV